MDLNILIIIVLLASLSSLLAIFYFLIYLKNKNNMLKISNLEKQLINHSEKERMIDTISSFIENNENTEQKLCESLRIITNSYGVFYLEMNKTNGSFKPKFYSCVDMVDIKEFESEYKDDKTLAIVTGAAGTSAIYNKNDNSIFPDWVKSIKFDHLISVPLIDGFETIGCLYIINNKKPQIETDENLRNIWLLTKIYQKTQSLNLGINNEIKLIEDSSINIEQTNESGSKLGLDHNMELLKFDDNEISLSNSEYLIMKKLIEKNGEILHYQEIENFLWPNKNGLNKSAMRLHIHRLRDKSNTISNDIGLIKTVRGKGIFLDLSLF